MRERLESCYYCGIEIGPLSRFPLASGQTHCVDHVIPKKRGGNNKPGNLVAACNICNSIKGDRTVEEVRHRLVQRMLGWPKFSTEQIEWLRLQGLDLSAYDNAKLAFERPSAESIAFAQS